MKRKGVTRSSDGHAAPKAPDELTGRLPAHEHISGTTNSELLRYATEKLELAWRGAHRVGDFYAKFDALGTLLREDERLFDALDVLSKGGDAKALKGLGQKACLPPRVLEVLPLLYAKAEAAVMKKRLLPLLSNDDITRRLKELQALCTHDALFRRKFEELIERKAGGDYSHPEKRANLTSAITEAGFDKRIVDVFLSELEAGYPVRETHPDK